jgi:hypothetical protein
VLSCTEASLYYTPSATKIRENLRNQLTQVRICSMVAANTPSNQGDSLHMTSPSEKEILQLAVMIYEAANDPVLWDNFLQA